MNGAVPEPAESSHTDLWVVGNVLIDLMMKGVPAIPRWGEEVLASGRAEQIGGQGANLARAAVRLGLSTELAAVVGDDPRGALIRETLAAEGVGTDGLLKALTAETALAIAAIRADGERAFITDLGSSAKLSVDDLAPHVEGICSSRAVALVGTANLPGLERPAIAALLRQAHSNGALTLFDPGWGDGVISGTEFDAILEITDVFLPNRDEAEALTGESDLKLSLGALRERCPGTVIVTCGDEGSVTLDGETLVRVEPVPSNVDNAVGAGDVFAAGVVSGLLDGALPADAMIRGTAAAAKYIARSDDRYSAIADWRTLAKRVVVRRL